MGVGIKNNRFMEKYGFSKKNLYIFFILESK